MSGGPLRRFHTPRESDLGLLKIANAAGLEAAVLPNACVFAIEHDDGRGRIMLNQMLGSPLGGAIGRILLRTEGATAEALGPSAKVRFGTGSDRSVWSGETGGLKHRVTLWLHPTQSLWAWRVEVCNTGPAPVTCDAIFVQDLGLGERNFVTGNEAFASQYIDHQIARHPRFGPVLMDRQNLAQCGRHPWTSHACLEGAASFATDALQLLGPAYRDAAGINLPFGTNLPGTRLQHEAACAILQSRAQHLEPGQETAWTFFGLLNPDHAEPSGEADLARIEEAAEALSAFAPAEIPLHTPVRSLLQDARPLLCTSGEDVALPADRMHEERRGGHLLSYFVPEGPLNRHAVLREKDQLMKRRHGAILKTGRNLLPDENALSVTCWMHGVFGAQLNGSALHKLLSASRDPYNIVRTGGLRILAEIGGEWRLLTLPSLFDMGLSDCRWVYQADARTIAVHAAASAEDSAVQWEISVEGEPCRFLIFAQIVLGERDYCHAGLVEVDGEAKRFTFRPEPDWLWGKTYPNATYHLVTSTPDAVEALGGSELLFADAQPHATPHIAMRTTPARAFRFAVVGSMINPAEAARLAEKYATPVSMSAMVEAAGEFWSGLMRNAASPPINATDRSGVPSPLAGAQGSAETASLDTIFPWMVHDALIHVAAPHGLEQYEGSAWGTRDVCQGPVEFLLALGHHAPVRQILKTVFGRQFPTGAFPQWFMLEPYSFIEGAHSHGDIPIWALKAVCDYIECTGETALLSKPIPWRDGSGEASIASHCARLIAHLQAQFIPGTHLVRLGEGDWNDSLQPTDQSLKEWTVSSWTVGLFYQQLGRYAAILREAGLASDASRLEVLASATRTDFNRHLIRDGVVAGYAAFDPGGGVRELLLHPSDSKTGVRYSLIPMTCGILGGIFTPEQAQAHMALIREHLLFPDGVRLMDRPLPYRGGLERYFRRAESSPFFGREVGLMYVHSHLRYCEAAAGLGDAQAFLDGLQAVNPIAVTDRLPHATLRQRNCYFTSSDAAFRDRYEAFDEWDRARQGTVEADGGWRIYSSGPGLFVQLLVSWLAERLPKSQ
jgi:1,2-beta-oligoglucan phosphorylase